jgi:flagellin-like protein
MKTRRSRKALSPVVASIILIAVTVAVSIAVAAWMGALTFNFMGSSSITITDSTFNSNSSITLTMKNTGTKQVTLGQVRINNVNVWANVTGTLQLSAGDAGKTLIINSYNWTNGNPYKIELYDSSGGGVGSTQQNAPGA